MLKLIFSIMLFFTANCLAAQSPVDVSPIQSTDDFYITSKNNINFGFKLDSVTEIPEATYRYLEGVFTTFYKKITFNTSITDSTFTNCLESDLFAIPLIATNQQGLQLEVFGNFSDFSKQYLSNLPTDHPLYEHFINSEQSSVDLLDNDLSLGAGISFNTSQSSKVKLVISNNDMPGYGGSRTLVGFETRF